MAETTAIAWCDSTFNAWIGCTKVSPGCDHCYAEALDARHRWGGNVHWGTAVPRYRTSANLWKQPLAWNRKAEASDKPWRVFTNSLADVFDNEVPGLWRADLFHLIEDTPFLTWLLLTKRIGNAAKMLPADWQAGWDNVWLGASIVNQDEADRDIPKLLATPAAKRFVSYEPALGPVNFLAFKGLDWIIVGGESRQGGKVRHFDLQWAYHAIGDAEKIGAAPFVKQLGSSNGYKDRAGADPAEWPDGLRIREFPESK